MNYLKSQQIEARVFFRKHEPESDFAPITDDTLGESIDANFIFLDIEVKKFSKQFSRLISGGNFDFSDYLPIGYLVGVRLQHSDRPLMKKVMQILRENGFGGHSSNYTASCNLPDPNPSEERAHEILGKLCDAISSGLSSLSKTEVMDMREYVEAQKRSEQEPTPPSPPEESSTPRVFKAIPPTRKDYFKPRRRTSARKIAAVLISVVVVGIFAYAYTNNTPIPNLIDSVSKAISDYQSENKAPEESSKPSEKGSKPSEPPKLIQPVIIQPPEPVEIKPVIIKPVEKPVTKEPKPAEIVKAVTYSELVSHALEVINQDRLKHGSSVVTLGNNPSAQKHAEDMLEGRYLSHWGTDGLKPYMRYTQTGGKFYVAENAAVTGYLNSESCNSKYVYCPSKDQMKAIEELQYNMMYDDAASDWGHRDNIIDKWHTKVNVGIAYSDTFFAMVQDFEGDYITWKKPITVSSTGAVEMAGVVNLKNFELFAVAINYDELPQKLTSDQLSRYPYNGAYDAGKDVDTIYPPLPPLPPGYYYEYIPDEHWADKWSSNIRNGYEDFDISFSLSNTLRQNGNGVYTIYLFTQNKNDEQLPLRNYSFKYENGILSSYSSSVVTGSSQQSVQKKVGEFTVTTDKSTYNLNNDSAITISG